MAALTAANWHCVAELQSGPAASHDDRLPPFVALDESATAVVDTARRHGLAAEPCLAELARAYRRHAV
jgi:hypothetical protein